MHVWPLLGHLDLPRTVLVRGAFWPSHEFMAQWAWNGFKTCPHMGQECPGWKGSQSEHNFVTDTKKSAKTCQKWPKIAQTMAIFHHKLLILWRKKIIVINIQLPIGSGQLLIPFGYLEVPLPAACSLVRGALWNRPAPLTCGCHYQDYPVSNYCLWNRRILCWVCDYQWKHCTDMTIAYCQSYTTKGTH